jgi:hypothetical protein
MNQGDVEKAISKIAEDLPRHSIKVRYCIRIFIRNWRKVVSLNFSQLKTGAVSQLRFKKNLG